MNRQEPQQATWLGFVLHNQVRMKGSQEQLVLNWDNITATLAKFMSAKQKNWLLSSSLRDKLHYQILHLAADRIEVIFYVPQEIPGMFPLCCIFSKC